MADGIAEAVRLSGRVIAKSRFPATFGPEVEVAEVDLDTTAVIVRGERLTEERAEVIAREVLDRSDDS